MAGDLLKFLLGGSVCHLSNHEELAMALQVHNITSDVPRERLWGIRCAIVDDSRAMLDGG